ncbi:MAG: ATP-binding protein [Thermodesulfobacteriota bacterium]
MSPQAPYTQLFRKMMIIAVMVALVPLFSLGGVIYYYFYISHQRQAQEELRQLVQSRANAIGLFLTERTAQLEALAHTTPLVDLASPGRLKEILNLLNRGYRSFVDLGVIDDEGNHLAYAGPYFLQDRNYRDATWFQETMFRGVFVSDVFLGYRGVPHFIIAVKIEQQPRPWILRATIDSDVFVRLVRFAQLGLSGDAFIVDARGYLQTPSRFGGGVLEQSGINPQSAPSGVSVGRRIDAQGKAHLTACAWLSKDGWLLVIDQDPREGLNLLAGARNIEIGILVIGTLIIVLSAYFLVRLAVRQLETAEREKAALDAQLVHSSRLAALGRMAAGVAHEINNPLAAIGEIAGLLDDLMDEDFVAAVPSGANYKEYVTRIGELVHRAGEVTHRMLGFARRMEPKLDSVAVNEVIQETVSFLEKEALYRSIEINLQLLPTLPRIKSDRSQLQQVFLNLLNNAVDAVAENGHIWIDSRITDHQVLVTFKDDGPGMDKSMLERIFDPFFTTKAPGQGTGLGLSISHSIMEKLGGSLMVTSEPGQGATFAVRIPLVLAD